MTTVAAPGVPAGAAAAIAEVRLRSGSVAAGVEALLAVAAVVPDAAELPTLTAHLRELASAVVTGIRELVAQAGDPDGLRAAGTAWSAGIGSPAGGLAGVLSADHLRADDHWTGIAADAYRTTLGPQSAALAAVGAAGSDLHAVLHDLAESISTFWTSVAVEMAVLDVTLLAAAVTAATGVGAPVGVGAAVAALAAFAATLAATLFHLQSLTRDARSRAALVARRVADDVAFPRGAWPRSTTDLADGSVTDGDGSDWEPR